MDNISLDGMHVQNFPPFSTLWSYWIICDSGNGDVTVLDLDTKMYKCLCLVAFAQI